jgi:hypothetical protein
MEGAKRRAEEPAVATRAPAEQADPTERRGDDGVRIATGFVGHSFTLTKKLFS